MGSQHLISSTTIDDSNRVHQKLKSHYKRTDDLTFEKIMEDKLRKNNYGIEGYKNNTDTSRRLLDPKAFKTPKAERKTYTDEVIERTS